MFMITRICSNSARDQAEMLTKSRILGLIRLPWVHTGFLVVFRKGGGFDDVGAETAASSVGHDLQAVCFVVGVAELQLVVSAVGGGQLLGPDGDLGDTGPLQAETGVQIAGGGREDGRVVAGLWESAAAGGAAAVGVADGEGERAAHLTFGAQS